MNNYDVIIIGAGPAGLSAAIYLKRAGINPLIIEKESPGGTLNKVKSIQNYPGYTEQSGLKLAFRMYSQVEALNIKIVVAEVININKDNLFSVETSKENYAAPYLILSTGKVSKKLECNNAKKFEQNGISYCVTCDGNLYKNKDVAVIGNGLSAYDAILYLSGIANKIYLINKEQTFKYDIKNYKNVEVKNDSKIEDLIGEEKLEKIKTNKDLIKVDGVFVCLGEKKNAFYYENLNLKADKKGIIVDHNMQTNMNNVYACGDMISKSLYQVITATSEGAVAATDIIKKIKKPVK